jgi:hypothetical protein
MGNDEEYLNLDSPENVTPGPSSQEVTFDGPRLTFTLLAMIIPFYIIGDRLFHFIWVHRTPVISLLIPMWIKAVSIVLAIVVHELIHGIVFALYAPHGFRSVTFGFNAKIGAFYCHCKEPIRVKHYRRAGIAPLIILGLIPLIIGFITGVGWFKTFGLLLTIGGFGDLLVYIKLLKFGKNTLLLDHPDKLGFILDPPSSIQ